MSDIRTWSVTAASNNQAVPDGAPEGWSGADVNDVVREVMAAIKRQYDDPEFIDPDNTPTLTLVRNSTTQFQINGADYTSTYSANRRIRIVGGTTDEGYVDSSSFTGGNTVVNVTMDGADVPASPTQSLVSFAGLRKPAFLTLADLDTEVKPYGNWWEKNGGNQLVTSTGHGVGSPVAITELANLTIPGADGSRSYIAHANLNVTGSVGDYVQAKFHMGANGDVTDAAILPRSIEWVGANVFMHMIWTARITPASGDKLTVSLNSNGVGNQFTVAGITGDNVSSIVRLEEDRTKTS